MAALVLLQLYAGLLSGGRHAPATRPTTRARTLPPLALASSPRTKVEGRGHARCKLPPGPLATYLMDSGASDATLLSAALVRDSSTKGAYECELAPIQFLSLQITPLMHMHIDRASDNNEVHVRIIQGNVRIGSKVQRATSIGGINTIRWVHRADDGWDLECKIDLELSLEVPGFEAMPSLARRAWIASSRSVMGVAAGSAARKLVRNVELSYAGYGAPGGGPVLLPSEGRRDSGQADTSSTLF